MKDSHKKDRNRLFAKLRTLEDLLYFSNRRAQLMLNETKWGQLVDIFEYLINERHALSRSCTHDLSE